MHRGTSVIAAIGVLVVGGGAGALALRSAQSEPECGPAATADSGGRQGTRLSAAQQTRAATLATADPTIRELMRSHGLVPMPVMPVVTHQAPIGLIADMAFSFGVNMSKPADPPSSTVWRVLRPVEGWCAVVEGRPTRWETQRVRAAVSGGLQVFVRVDLVSGRVLGLEPTSKDTLEPLANAEPLEPPEVLADDSSAAGRGVELLRRDAIQPVNGATLERAVAQDLALRGDLPAGLVADWRLTQVSVAAFRFGAADRLAGEHAAELPQMAAAWRRLGYPKAATLLDRLARRVVKLGLPPGILNHQGRYPDFAEPVRATTNALDGVHLRLLREHREAFITALGG